MRYIITLLFITLFFINGFSQTGKIEGKITDSKTSQPLSGVSVSISGNDKGVISDQDGHFVITTWLCNPPINQDLVCRIQNQIN